VLSARPAGAMRGHGVQMPGKDKQRTARSSGWLGALAPGSVGVRGRSM
jgi:hypothetical protein